MLKDLTNILNPVNKLKRDAEGDKTIWIIVFLLWLASIVVVYSASGIMLINTDIHSYSFLTKQTIFIVLGAIIIFYIHKMDYIFFMKIAFPLFICSLVLLFLTLFIGQEINGAKRWINIPLINIQFQPSDIAKVSLVIYLAKKLAQNQKNQLSYIEFSKIYVLPIMAISMLVMIHNLSTALMMIISSFIILFLGRVSFKHLLKTILLVFVLPISFMLLIASSYYDKEKGKRQPLPSVLRVSRIPTWISRVQGFMYEKKSEQNYQIQQSKIAIVHGGIVGVGPGNSGQRYFLPSSYADFVYSIFVEEYGLIGGIVLLVLYLLLFIRGINIFSKCEYAFGGFVAIGLCLILVLQAFFNVCVNVGLMPNTGVPLPLVSMGGTSYIVSCFAIGVILSVAKTGSVSNIEKLKVTSIQKLE